MHFAWFELFFEIFFDPLLAFFEFLSELFYNTSFIYFKKSHDVWCHLFFRSLVVCMSQIVNTIYVAVTSDVVAIV